MNNKNIIGNNISDLLAKNEMTSADLARKLDVSRSTVSCWISGTKVPRMEKVEKMCSIFSCNRSAILSEISFESLDALEEDIITRFRQLDNKHKMIAYREFNGYLDLLETSQKMEEMKHNE